MTTTAHKAAQPPREQPPPRSRTRRLKIQSVVDHVYSALRTRILSGQLARGSRLRQEVLAEELGVSRTPLREALRRLATEGLVELETNRGATVTNPDAEDMRQAWLARVALEPGAARLAAERADPQVIARMRAAVEAQKAARHDVRESFAVNREFHLALVSAAANPHLTRFAEMLWVTRLGMPILAGQAVEPADVASWAGEHERILEAVERGDADQAERLAREHVASHPPRLDDSTAPR